MFIAKKYCTFNEFIFFSEYSVLLRVEIDGSYDVYQTWEELYSKYK